MAEWMWKREPEASTAWKRQEGTFWGGGKNGIRKIYCEYA
jgi:hypothetical protein